MAPHRAVAAEAFTAAVPILTWTGPPPLAGIQWSLGFRTGSTAARWRPARPVSDATLTKVRNAAVDRAQHTVTRLIQVNGSRVAAWSNPTCPPLAAHVLFHADLLADYATVVCPDTPPWLLIAPDHAVAVGDTEAIRRLGSEITAPFMYMPLARLNKIPWDKPLSRSDWAALETS